MIVFLCLFIQQVISDCTYKSNLIYIDDDSSLEDIKDEFRPTFLRLTSPGCPYSPASQAQWESAASLFPHVNFVTVNCWKNTKISSLFGKSINTPYHGFVLANTTVLFDNEDAKFGGSQVEESPDKFSDVITKYANLYPIAPPLTKLVPMTTDSFYENADEPIILLYNSECSDEVPFLTAWSKAANEEIVSETDHPIIGIIDCSTFPRECRRWSYPYAYKTPRALVYSKKTNQYQILETYNSITLDLIDGMRTNAMLLPVQPTPTPVPISYPQHRVLSSNGCTVLENKGLQSRTISDVKQRYGEAFVFPGEPCLDGCGDVYDENLNCVEVLPNPADIENSIKILNFFRWLAGLSNDVVEDKEWSSECRAAALNMHRYGVVPSDHILTDAYMKESICGHESLKQVALDSLLSQNTQSCFHSTYDLFKDEGANNDGIVGHRRWLLHPNLKKIGLGFHPFKLEKMNGYSMQRCAVNVLRIKKDNNVGYIENSVPESLDFISWPPQGPFPIEHLPSNWHISHPSFRDAELSDIKIQITREDGAELKVEKASIEKGNVNRDSLVLTMSKEALARCTVLRKITVRVRNNKAKLFISYSFQLFDTKPYTEVCFYTSDSGKCPESTTERAGNGAYNLELLSNAENLVKIYVVDDINYDQEIAFTANQRFIITGKKLNAKIRIGCDTKIDFDDPSQTDVVINWKVNSKKVGVLDTSKYAKSIKIEVEDEAEKVKLHSVEFYTGLATKCSLSKSVFRGPNKDVFYNFGGDDYKYVLTVSVADVTENFIVGDAFSYYEDIKGDYPGTVINSISEMKNQKSVKRTIRVFFAYYDYNKVIIDVDSFIPGRKKDYQFVKTSGQYVSFVCDLNIRDLANSITFQDLSDRFSPPPSKYTFDIAQGKNQNYEKEQCPIDNVTIKNAKFSTSNYFYMKSVLGDDDAKAKYPNDFIEYYPSEGTESSNVIDTLKKGGSKLHAYVLIDGKYNDYTVMLDSEGMISGVKIYTTYTIRAEESARSKPVKIKIVDRKQQETIIPNRGYGMPKIYFENFDDLTIDNPTFDGTTSYHGYFNFTNCKKVKFVGSPSSGSSDSVIVLNKPLCLGGNADAYIDYGVKTQVPELSSAEEGSFNIPNLETVKLTVDKNQEFSGLSVTKNIVVDSASLTLKTAKLNKDITIAVSKTKSHWPSISLVDSDFSSMTIQIDLGISNSRLMSESSEEYESHIIVSGLGNSGCSSIKDKATLTNGGQFELRCSKDNQNLIVAKGEEPIYDLAGDEPTMSISDDDDYYYDDVEDSENESGNNGNDGGKGGLPVGGIIGIVVAVIIVVVAVVVGVFFYLKKKRTNSSNCEIQGDGEGNQVDTPDQNDEL